MAPILIKIRRTKQNGEPYVDEFSLPVQGEMTVLDALSLIKDQQDGSLTFRFSCRMGICGSCGMMVNGKPVLTCQTYLHHLSSGPVKVEPLRHFPVIKDLVVDIEDPMEKFRSVMPWSNFQKNSVSGEARKQTPKELSKINQESQCVKCMLCYSACPVYGLDKSFIGPAAAALAYRYEKDSREKNELSSRRKRMSRMAAKDGVWNCSFVGECSVVCPKRVDPALALQRLKLMGLKHILLPDSSGLAKK